MKTIIVTFYSSDEIQDSLTTRYLNVTDDFIMFGTFVGNQEYHQMKKKDKKNHLPFSVLMNNEYGLAVYKYAERCHMELTHPYIEIHQTQIEFLPKN